MADTTARVLHLLGLLQSRTLWTGAELAERLGVTARCVRRDVERLRELGYSDEQLAEVVGLVALNVLTGAFNLVAGTHPTETARSAA